MALEEGIIDWLIDEDERMSVDDGNGTGEGISSWNRRKKEKNLEGEEGKRYFPVIRKNILVPKIRVVEKLHLSKLNSAQLDKEVNGLAMSEKRNRVKLKLHAKLLTIAELKSTSHLLSSTRVSPNRSRFRHSNIIKQKSHKSNPKPRRETPFPFNLVFPSPHSTSQASDFKPSPGKILGSKNPSQATEKFFIHSNSINTLKSKSTIPERIRIKYRLPSPGLKEAERPFPKPTYRSKSPNSEKYKIKKNLLLAPIYQNICKYNSALK